MGVASIEAFEAAASWFFTNGVMKAVFGSSDERTCTLLSTYIISFDGIKMRGTSPVIAVKVLCLPSQVDTELTLYCTKSCRKNR